MTPVDATTDERGAAPVLIVAATEGEVDRLVADLDGPTPAGAPGWPHAWRGGLAGRPVILAVCGVGKANAAAAVATFAARERPAACLMTGIAGAYAGAFVPVGAAVAAEIEIDLDAGVLEGDEVVGLATIPLPRVDADGHGPARFETFPTDPAWRDALAAACGVAPQAFATSDAVSGDLDVAAARADRSGAAIESMEGAGAALACARLGLPFGEVRGVSNVAGIRDKDAWEIRGAVAAVTTALKRALRDGPR